jgi:hypothetical protein
MPRFDRSASMDSSSAVLRASRSGLVTVSTPPSRRKAGHSVSFARFAVLDTCSAKVRLAPAALRSRSYTARQPGPGWSFGVPRPPFRCQPFRCLGSVLQGHVEGCEGKSTDSRSRCPLAVLLYPQHAVDRLRAMPRRFAITADPKSGMRSGFSYSGPTEPPRHSRKQPN